MNKTILHKIKRIFSLPPFHLTTLSPYFIIPVIFLIVVTIAHYGRGPFYLSSVDPEYFYMYNGVILGAGNLSIQYYAHPGTPLHFLIAISSRISDLFLPGDYMKNFVDDPEKFIHAANLFLNIIIAIVLFICGKQTLKYTGSPWAALLIQLSPFASFSLLSMSGRLIPEAMLMIPMLLLVIMILKNTFEPENVRNTRKDLFIYSLIIAFGIACKLTFIPFVVLPLILLQSTKKEKLRYLAYTLLFFIIFAYPLLFNFGDAWRWISGIFSHSGKYGTGAANFIDISSIGKHINALIQYVSGFLYILSASLLLILVLSLKPVRRSLSPDPRIVRAIFSLDVTILVAIALVLKHFELYYFMPFTLFKMLIFLLMVFLVIRLKPVSESRPMKWAVVLITLSLVATTMVIQVKQFRTNVAGMEAKKAKSIENSRKILSLINNEEPVIIDAPYYGSPFIEFAHYSGFLTSRHLKGFYKAYLKEKFPNYYNCPDWSEKFYHWDNFVDFSDILATVKSSFYIYIGKDKSEDLVKIENKISQVLDQDKTITRILYKDPETGEQLIEIIVNP